MTVEIYKEEEYKPKRIDLKEIPKDVWDILLDLQVHYKKKCNCQLGLEQTIYKAVRELKHNADKQ
ncbi:MAG: hypothetical protein IPJ81_00640 [Chitinophagaceae bacterium]|nr:hypothetical protein [Chitinophagaceae bacterium]